MDNTIGQPVAIVSSVCNEMQKYFSIFIFTTLTYLIFMR